LNKGLGQFKARAKRLRATESNAEARLWQALRNRRLARHKFRRQYPIDRYVADFVTLDTKLIIEIDGATHSTDAELAYDAERTRVLESLGFHVIRITNTDVYDNLDGVMEPICSTLENATA
jgi:very-short-patch-repair endonuclease